jgi:hypothetical protein
MSSVCVCGKEVAGATVSVCSVVVCCTNGVRYMNQGLLSCDPRDGEMVEAQHAVPSNRQMMLEKE